MNKETKTVEIPVSWFESLLELAKTADNSAPKPSSKQSYDRFLHCDLPRLIGYISSAKSVIN